MSPTQCSQYFSPQKTQPFGSPPTKSRRAAAADDAPHYTVGRGRSDAEWHDYLAALRVQGAATPRLVGHLFSIGGSHQLEGTYLKQTTHEMLRALRALEGTMTNASAPPRMREVMAQLSRLAGWTSRILHNLALLPLPGKPQEQPPRGLAQEMAATIQAQPRVLLPASVRGKDGSHAALVEVVTQPDGRYTLRLFNSSYHDLRQYGDPRTGKQASHFDVNDIPAAIMENPAYIQALLRLSYASDRPFHAAIKTLYDWTVAYGVLAPPPTDDLHASQSVGNCAWKCVSSYVRDRLPETTYLRLKLDHRTRVLTDYALSARTPALVAYMVPLFGAGLVGHASYGMPALETMHFPTPVGYAPVPVGWTWTYRPDAAALMHQAQKKLDKSFWRYVASVMEQIQGLAGDALRVDNPAQGPPAR